MRDQHGRFLPGPDPDRHQHDFTPAQRRKGYRVAMRRTAAASIGLHAWLWRRVRGYYRALKRERKEGGR